MIDPLSPLYHLHAGAAGALTAKAPDPVASAGLMIVGIVIIVVTAAWSLGGLGAAVYTWLEEAKDRRDHNSVRRRDRSMRS